MLKVKSITGSTLFLRNQNGLDTVCQMCGSCSRCYCNEMVNSLSYNSSKEINKMVDQAIKEQWQLVLVIDDCTSNRIRHRPTMKEKPSMCTCSYIKINQDYKSSTCLPDVHLIIWAITVLINLMMSPKQAIYHDYWTVNHNFLF